MTKTCRKRSLGFKIVDILYICLIVLPILGAIVLKVLTKPQTEGITITGAQIYFTVKMPFQDLIVTEAQINSWCVIVTILGICLFLTRGLKTREVSVRQHIAEWLVEKAESLVNANMGEYFLSLTAFIGAILALSAFSSLLSLFGLFPPTSDINVVGGWAILVFAVITYYKFKCGPLGYIKSFGEPVKLLAPLNIISEVATPFAMAFRHYGNIISGTVIGALLSAAFQGLSKSLLGWLPGVLGDIPFLQIGIPAILSLYFDVFSGVLQAYIFAMLTMMYVSSAFNQEEYFIRQQKKQLKNK